MKMERMITDKMIMRKMIIRTCFLFCYANILRLSCSVIMETVISKMIIIKEMIWERMIKKS